MRKRSVPSNAWLVLAFVVVATAGCGHYSTSGRTPKDIRSIHVPFFENETPEPNIEITVTEGIIASLIDDNTLKVTSEDRADAVLEGRVTGFENRPFSFNQDLGAEEYLVRIRVEVTLFNRTTNQTIWDKRGFSGDGSYFLDDVEGGGTFEDAVAESLEEITDRILNLTVQDW